MPKRLLPSHPLPSTTLPSHPNLTPIGSTTASASDYASRITLGKPGRCPDDPTITIVAFDNEPG